ncbi:MAG: hypothetical protein A2X13_07405 [Bacteroidetes bacterium GWC2_33_15]|nr:MAG: hypothetical protein A2X10_01260 [Bacteroidetes bacterium GWA2_33_15]OFX48613.1 MAG: hypothetical protein A2X13_07405 [Bacteroidetes bacterium GWC2_33_15]OFX64587.1 MAG: hypothetical protein A2X15_04995 [Bacteroidetes bacterium GWB2_32_14]OFX67995.1 MAG: hypothetical protein A2X14_01780 [Bacteroidetes bacterium GWD2_33_33]HAN18229.1 DUF4293 domain-containing protein [Bacteroidales bacterium]
MLQRIQTMYLLIISALMGSVFFLPLAELLANDNHVFTYYFNGLFLDGQKEIYFLTISPIILLSIIVLISFGSIFLFKKRIIQMRLNVINLILMLGYSGINYYYVKSFSSQLEGVVSYNIPVVFPILAAILTYFAIRAIGKDEALIRSLDRIR